MRTRPTTRENPGGTPDAVASGVGVPARRGSAAFIGPSLLVAMAAAVVVLRTTGGTAEGDPRRPEAYFAVRDGRTEIVEVETATGNVRRTLVDFGPSDGTGQPSDSDPEISIETLDLAADRSSLFFGRFSLPERYAVYRLDLPHGPPVRLAAGRGPSVSPDGRRLAYAHESAIRVRDLDTGEEQVFEDVFGELGGITTSWSADSTVVAFEVEAADSFHPGLLDTAGGEVIKLVPREGPSPGGYTAYSPVFRHTDGRVALGCCFAPVLSPDIRPPAPRLALHDPETGREAKRRVLPFAVGALDFDRSGLHLLALGPDGPLHRTGEGRFLEMSGPGRLDLAVW